MAACSPWTYRGVNSQVFRSLQTLGRKQGFALPSTPSGGFTVQTAGVKVHFRYAWNKSDSTLQLQCVNRPTAISCTVIKGIANRIVTQCGGTSG